MKSIILVIVAVLSLGLLGTAQVSLAVPNTNVPPGLSISPQGVLSGTPTTPGLYQFIVQVTDPVTGATASETVTLTVNAPIAITTPSTLPNGGVRLPYNMTFQATGGSGTYQWSVLPSNVSQIVMDSNTSK